MPPPCVMSTRLPAICGTSYSLIYDGDNFYRASFDRYLCRMEKKLFLLDAMALIYRAYYSMIRNPIITTRGKTTNAQYGFTNTLLDLLNREKPSHIAVAFDTQAPTERHTEFEAYKAQRQEVPEDILTAIPEIKEILSGFNIPVVECDGYEADDLIGGLAQQAEKEGFKVYMVTPDKDFGQLVTENIYIYKPGYQGGTFEILGVREVCERWNVQDVAQVVDVLGLMGDASDNIPGIPGVGEKTAAKLLAEYKTLENVLENAANIKGALGKKIQEGKDLAILSKKLATIITDVPCKFHAEEFKRKPVDKEKLTAIFTELEFKSIGKRVLGEDYSVFDSAPPSMVQGDLFGSPREANETPVADATPSAGGLVAESNLGNTPHNYTLVRSDEEIADLIEQLRSHPEVAIDIESDHPDATEASMVGIAFSVKPHQAWFLPVPAAEEDIKSLLQKFRPVFEDASKLWIGHDIKYNLLLLKWYGFDLKGRFFDIMVAHYLVESEGRRSMDLLSAQYLGYVMMSFNDMFEKKPKGQASIHEAPVEKLIDYSGEKADVSFRLKSVLSELLEERNVSTVYWDVEAPLISVLRDMEYEGVNVDVGFLNDYSFELEKAAFAHEEKVYKEAGVRFNLSSPKQLGEVLFETMQIEGNVKRTKGGQYATGEDVLNKLAKDNPIIEDILNYRELTKLRSTYVDALPLLVNKRSSRVHTCFGQTTAVTGRLSSTNPNLQNIPIRTARGREIRKAFIPRDKDHLIISADYSQIELRIVAAISGDPSMSEAFKAGKDIHLATAAKVFNVPEEEVTTEMRYKAKSVNFGIIYGQSAFGLAENINVSRTEAKDIIDAYKKEFSHIQRYMTDTIEFCKTNGYVQTLLGRKRWIKDIQSRNWTVRGFAERNAINSPIQGTAADMIKLAMIRIAKELDDGGFKTRMVLQVHDELVFDAPRDEVEEVKPLIIDAMVHAVELPGGVPVVAGLGVGQTWLEAH